MSFSAVTTQSPELSVALATLALRAVAGTAALVLIAGYTAGTAATARTRTPANPAVVLATWLSAHHLTEGWGTYWDSTVTTVASDNRVHVVPVIGINGQLHGFGDIASDAWFTPTRPNRTPAIFLVYEPASPWGDVNLTTASATFGPPQKQARVGIFEVLLWDHDTTSQIRPVVVS